MINDLLRSFVELKDRRVRGVLWLGIGLSLVTLVALGFGVEALLDLFGTTGYPWVDATIDVLGVLGTALVAWFFFPSIVVAVSSFFVDRVVEATERRLRPDMPAARLIPLAGTAVAALRLLAISLLLNLVALPLYFLPIINIPLWLGLNGYLVGREYIELVAQRRMPLDAVGPFRKRHRLAWWLPGVVIAFLLTIPFLNLIAPIIGASFMTRRFHRLPEASRLP